MSYWGDGSMRIFVDAYTEKNLGDDLFLKILFDRYPKNIEWFVKSNNQENLEAFRNYGNVYHFDKGQLRYKEFDAVINIGGSIFMQNGNWWIKHLVKRLIYALPMKLHKKPVFIIGCNYGPSNSKLMYRLNKLYIKYFVRDISFRDNESYSLFKDLQNVRFSPDIVYSLENKLIKRETSKNLGISIMHFEDKKVNDVYINKMVEITKAFLNDGYEVEFFSFCENQNDEQTFINIETLLGKKIVHNLYSGKDLNAYLERFSIQDYFITLRFHSLILSQIYNITYYPIIYSKKTSNVLEDQGFKGNYTTIENIDVLTVDQIKRQFEDKSINFGMKQEIKINAAEHFQEIDQFLKVNMSDVWKTAPTVENVKNLQ